jgi:hypothetical protein
MIKVKNITDTQFEVVVAEHQTTTHNVTVEPSYYQKLTGGSVPPETLVEKSFEFLLDREPNTSILRSFDLTVINRYFPEYERTIQKRLGTQ